MKLKKNGFTIVELMIATTILSFILVMVTAVMINIGNLYFKGITQVRTQDAVRSIADDLTHNLQLGSQVNPGGSTGYIETFGDHITVNSFCIDDVRYTYVLYIQEGHTLEDQNNVSRGSDLFKHVLWRDNLEKASECIPADLTLDNPSSGTGGSNGTELVPAASRLSQFSISPITSPYGLYIGVAYGDNDLIDKYDTNTPICKGGKADKFCSTAGLHTTVLQRVTYSN
ncbi:MAG TPA: type II secretion system protein [Candidatus Saccharimonadales bacterium]|nr:type II secretion system protein [Candidatus Saccharimonadales bacterium]